MTKSNKSAPIWFSKALLESEAFRALATANAHKVLAMFYIKRQYSKIGRQGKERWKIVNNGEIEFTYPESKKKLGITDGTFRNAIDELRIKGFIDIAEYGGGLNKSKNLYEISDRWKLYGTPEYKPPKPRPKPATSKGFQKGNQLGRNCKNKKTTVKD